MISEPFQALFRHNSHRYETESILVHFPAYRFKVSVRIPAVSETVQEFIFDRWHR